MALSDLCETAMLAQPFIAKTQGVLCDYCVAALIIGPAARTRPSRKANRNNY
jgi:hypothetical protein